MRVVGSGVAVRKVFDQRSARTDRERLALKREPIGCDIGRLAPMK